MTGLPVLHVQKVSGISGSEAHLLAVLPGLRERGWDARMAMLHEGEEGAQEFAGELRRRGVPLDEIRLRADLDPVALVRLTRLVRRLRPRILHTHLVHGDVYGQPAGTLARVPLRVSTKHGFNEFRDRRLFALGDRAVSGLAHVQVAISRGLAQYLAEREGFSESAFEIVHYGIEPGSEPGPYAGDEPRLLCIGRLVPIKGHSILLRAFAAAREQVPGLSLDLAGAGPLEAELRAEADRLGLGEAVAFLGRVAPVQPAIEASAIVVVPSLGEGFGMVALEAMERGRAVIASDVGGLGELVRDGETGLLVEPGSVAPLCDAIVALARDLDRARALGRAGRARAVAEFSQERCLDRTEELYRSALARRRLTP